MVATRRYRAPPTRIRIDDGGTLARREDHGFGNERGCVAGVSRRNRTRDVRPCGDSSSSRNPCPGAVAGIAAGAVIVAALLTDGASGHAHTIHHNHTQAAAFTNLNDHAGRLSNRCWRHCLCRCCDCYCEARNSDQPDHAASPLLYGCLRKLGGYQSTRCLLTQFLLDYASTGVWRNPAPVFG